MTKRVTRGRGRLESFLAHARVRQALALLPQSLRRGAILDIGCGQYPLFLERCGFHCRTGLDAGFTDDVKLACQQQHITLMSGNVWGDDLPFDTGDFDAVTMLAVFEHIPEVILPGVLREVHRILKPNGVFVMTTPTPLGDIVLRRVMAPLGLVSREEIDEHEHALSAPRITQLLCQAGFHHSAITTGRFELAMNRWLRAARLPD